MGLIDVATLRSPDSPDTNVTMITDPAVSSDTLAGSLRTANGALAATLPEHQKPPRPVLARACLLITPTTRLPRTLPVYPAKTAVVPYRHLSRRRVI